MKWILYGLRPCGRLRERSEIERWACEMSDYFIGPQVLTLAIPLGFFLLVCFWLFFQRERTR